MWSAVGDDGLVINDLHEKSGFVSVMGSAFTKPKEMSCEEAEIYRENHIRGKFGFERTDQMPPKQGKFAKTCRRCYRPSGLRCSSCRSNYCSRACQKQHWSRHVFVCRLAKRPNNVDYLKTFIRQWSRATGDEWKQAQTLSELYSDDDLCKTFGFNNCGERHDVANLLCFYTHMTSRLSTNELQLGVDQGNLGDYMTAITELIQYEKEAYRDCPCFAWFLRRRSFIDCVIPNWAGDFAYQAAGYRRAEHALSIKDRDDDVHPLSTSEKEVLNLYSILFRDFNNIPGPLNSNWLRFGFCYCTNRAQSMELAKLYVRLAISGTSLEEIARAYEEETLPALMERRGLHVSTILQAKGIAFHRPDLEELGIYRLVAEVHHTLSGRFCYCHLLQAPCHPKFQTHLSRESDGDYGFHGTNTWERWQLFNFFKHVFAHPDFDARKMQEAKRHPDKDELDRYLDSLVPGFRKNIGNRLLGDIFFPKLKAGIKFPNGRQPCWCVMHDTIDPEGLNCFTSKLVSQLRTVTQGNEEQGAE